MVSLELSFGDEANEYEEFPPTQLFEKGDVFASLAEGINDIVMQLLPPHLMRRVQHTIRCLKTCLTPSQQQRSLKRPHVDPRWNQVYAICVMSRSLGNVTLLLFNRCHVMHAVQPTTFGLPS